MKIIIRRYCLLKLIRSRGVTLNVRITDARTIVEGSPVAEARHHLRDAIALRDQVAARMGENWKGGSGISEAALASTCLTPLLRAFEEISIALTLCDPDRAGVPQVKHNRATRVLRVFERLHPAFSIASR